MRRILLLMSAIAISWGLYAQELAVSGRVTSAEDGSTLPGVNVLVKGTTRGTTTDADGKYSLSVPTSGGVLVISFIGLKTQEVEIGGRTSIDVSLEPDATQLSEVVVTGVGVPTEKRKLGIAVESVTAAQLPIAPTASIDQALIGKIPGAQIQSINGAPGSDINILLRGVNTINRGTAPMIMVDGVQMAGTSLNSLDLNSVERVEVVQGAAAASIFGAQGANGVIQVFTKKGTEGKINIDFSSSFASNEYLNVGDLRKADLHGFGTNASNQVIGASTLTPLTQDPTTLVYSENVIFNNIDPATNINKPYDQNLEFHDHIKEFFTSARATNYSIAVSGGSKTNDFSLSASTNKQESNFKGDGYNQRSNFTSNIGITLAKGLKFRSVTQLVYTKNTVDIYQKQDFGLNGLVFGIFNARPFVDYEMLDTKGNHAYYYGDASGVNQQNPNYVLQYQDSDDKKVDVVQSFNLNYAFPKFVEVDLKYGINHQDRSVKYIGYNQSDNDNSIDQDVFVSWYSPANTGEMTDFTYKNTFQNFLASTTAKFDLAEDFDMSIPLKSITQVAFDYRKDVRGEYYTSGLGIPLDPPLTANQATSYSIRRDYSTEFVTYGYVLSQRFEYGDIAGVSGGFRSDYSSAFGQGSKPFTFPRADAFFRISGLNFWDGSGIGNVILDWKFRAAYGKAGIQPQPYDRFPTLTTRTLGSSGALYFGPGQSNPNLDVEVSTETEIGTDLVFQGLGGNWLTNITLSPTYWSRSTDNAIYTIDAPPSSGVGTVLDNAFSLSSKGWQAALTATAYSGADFSWNATINLSKQSSQIDAVKGGAEVVVLSNAGSSNYVLRAGDKIGQLYGYKILTSMDAVSPVTGLPYLDAANQALHEVASNGYVVNKTTKQPFFTPEKSSFGDPYPKFNMAFINNFTYKDFLTVGIQVDWVHGNHLYNQTKEWMYRDGIHSDYTKPITINGETGAWSAFYRGIYAQRQANGTKDYFYEDASFVRLRNVSVGVDFAKVFDLKMSRLQLVFTGRNLWTKTDYTGMDPEISSGTTNSAWDRGVDHNTIPNFKTYQATLNVGF